MRACGKTAPIAARGRDGLPGSSPGAERGVRRCRRARQPRSALNWLRKGAGASLPADVAAGRLTLTHQARDAHPRRHVAGYLRHMLTAGGALPRRDEELSPHRAMARRTSGNDRAGH